MISLARKYPNVFIDTSAYKAKRFPSELVDYMRADGSDKVLFGSNYPMILPDDCLEGLDEFGLDERCEEKFMHDNAARVFGL